MSQEENMVYDGEVTQSLNLSSDLAQVVEDNDESKLPRRRLNKNWISVPNLVDEDEEQVLDDGIVEQPTANLNDKVEKKRQRKRDESGLEKSKKKQKSDNSTEIKEMWDSITNDSKDDDGDKVKENRPKKYEEIDKLFRMGRKKSKKEKDESEIAMQVEKVMATLEIAVEDDVELNKKGKPAITKLMKLPLLNESLSKKQLQATFLDHGVLNLLKNWLEPLPDGSLPNINIRAAVLTILNDLRIDLDQNCRREQLSKSGLGTVLMFLSKSDEETTPNKRLANELVNKWSRIIYNKSTSYENMYTEEEQEENQQILLKRQNKTAPKVSETKARDFDIDVDFARKRQSKLAASKEVGRASVPQAMSMDFTIRPQKEKIDKKLEALVKFQMDTSSIHGNIIDKLKKNKALRRQSLQVMKVSATRAHYG
ncbi:unnamed protein product [Arabis nemorensis]|uniref:TFIIS N-terminal domain-containing protein n=1 Tax=Arabis nemorensis TaxID=586526 RepID=A0A565CFK2_9BRAS|nr:unnamed protein product [Arabis nemorensis]